MRIAVIGSGISGISAAWLLSHAHDVDVYEAEAANSAVTRARSTSTAGGVTFPVDTGFQVFNRRTYPNLTRFFEHLGIDAHDADMSFSVQVRTRTSSGPARTSTACSRSARTSRTPGSCRCSADVLRFSRDADRLLADPTIAELTLGQLLKREGYSDGFTDWYLIPMGDAIWSTPPGDMLDYPAHTFLRFCDNHGLLHITGKPQWLSVKGGARSYVEAASKIVLGRGLRRRACREESSAPRPACA